jgi:hypothetical protein
LLALVSLLGFMIFTRSEIETTALKVPGTLYQRTETGNITNLYNIEFVNKTFDPVSLTVKVEQPTNFTIRKVGDPETEVPPGEMLKGVYFLESPADKVTSAKMVVVLGIYRGNEKLETVKVKFIGPVHSHKDRLKGGR